MGLDILAFSLAVDKLSVDNMVDYEENMLCIMLQYFSCTLLSNLHGHCLENNTSIFT